jgi:hypothetical protein
MANVCKNFNDEGCPPYCEGVADPAYTMDFTDVEPGCYFYWCSKCGPVSRALEAGINEAFATRPGFADEFKKAMDNVVAKSKKEDA